MIVFKMSKKISLDNISKFYKLPKRFNFSNSETSIPSLKFSKIPIKYKETPQIMSYLQSKNLYNVSPKANHWIKLIEKGRYAPISENLNFYDTNRHLMDEETKNIYYIILFKKIELLSIVELNEIIMTNKIFTEILKDFDYAMIPSFSLLKFLACTTLIYTFYSKELSYLTKDMQRNYYSRLTEYFDNNYLNLTLQDRLDVLTMIGYATTINYHKYTKDKLHEFDSLGIMYLNRLFNRINKSKAHNYNKLVLTKHIVETYIKLANNLDFENKCECFYLLIKNNKDFNFLMIDKEIDSLYQLIHKGLLTNESIHPKIMKTLIKSLAFYENDNSNRLLLLFYEKLDKFYIEHPINYSNGKKIFIYERFISTVYFISKNKILPNINQIKTLYENLKIIQKDSNIITKINNSTQLAVMEIMRKSMVYDDELILLMADNNKHLLLNYKITEHMYSFRELMKERHQEKFYELQNVMVKELRNLILKQKAKPNQNQNEHTYTLTQFLKKFSNLCFYIEKETSDLTYLCKHLCSLFEIFNDTVALLSFNRLYTKYHQQFIPTNYKKIILETNFKYVTTELIEKQIKKSTSITNLIIDLNTLKIPKGSENFIKIIQNLTSSISENDIFKKNLFINLSIIGDDQFKFSNSSMIPIILITKMLSETDGFHTKYPDFSKCMMIFCYTILNSENINIIDREVLATLFNLVDNISIINNFEITLELDLTIKFIFKFKNLGFEIPKLLLKHFLVGLEKEVMTLKENDEILKEGLSIYFMIDRKQQFIQNQKMIQEILDFIKHNTNISSQALLKYNKYAII